MAREGMAAAEQAGGAGGDLAPVQETAGGWTPELDAQARAVCGRLVEASLGALLRTNAELGVDDVVSRCVERIWQAFPKFDPTKGSFSTFCGRNANWVIGDVRRKHARRARIGDGRPAPASARAEAVRDVDPDPLDGRDMVAWAQDLFTGICELVEQAKEADPRAVGRVGRPPVYSAVQQLAVQSLRRKLNLSIRGTTLLLQQNENLRIALRLTKPPGRDFVHRATKSVRQFKKIFTARPANPR